MEDIAKYLRGEALFGDDFDADQINDWFAQEIEGYYGLAQEGGTDVQSSAAYPYDALNYVHGFRHIAGRRFGRAVALGTASGRDVVPIAPQVENFYCIEPAQTWWRDDIAGTPSTYVAPRPSGTIALEDGSADLAIALSVLHHIPNVSAVLGELVRVLAPGGVLVLREPITSMGDWRNPRRGLTRNERGLPAQWLKDRLASMGMRPLSARLCVFPPLREGLSRIGLGQFYYTAPMLAVDAALSQLFAFNVRYHRQTLWQRFAPAVFAGVYVKTLPA